MTTDWPTMPLRDAGVSLLDCEHRTPPDAGTGYPYIAIPQIKNGRLDLAEVRRITPEHFAEWTRKARPQANDVILSRRCNPGETAVVPAGLECALGQNLVLLRADDRKMYPPFLRWLVRGPQWWEQIGKFLNVGAVFDSLKCADIPKFELSIPPLAVQRRVADVLGSLDDKIELNKRMNETLEAMALTLFHSWFVAYDPVQARAEGRKPQGVDKESAKLFPDCFGASPLGKIPKGWTVAPLGEHVEAVKGLSYKGDGLADAGMPLHNLNSVYEGGWYKYEGIKFYTGEYKERHIIRPGDVIVANTEQGHDLLLIGYPAIVPRYFGETGLFSHHLYRVRPRPSSPLTNHFIFFQLMDQRLRDEVTGHTNGTTVNMLAVDGLQRPLFVLPPADLIRAFDRVVSPIFDKAEQIHTESLELGRVRNGLLPKLLSGEVRV
jgi:type I restriction enzyme S subunit